MEIALCKTVLYLHVLRCKIKASNFLAREGTKTITKIGQGDLGGLDLDSRHGMADHVTAILVEIPHKSFRGDLLQPFFIAPKQEIN